MLEGERKGNSWAVFCLSLRPRSSFLFLSHHLSNIGVKDSSFLTLLHSLRGLQAKPKLERVGP